MYIKLICSTLFTYPKNDVQASVFEFKGNPKREIDFCTLLNGFSTLVNFGKKCLKKHIDKGQKNNFDIFTSIFVISMWKNHVLFSHRYDFLILSFNV